MRHRLSGRLLAAAAIAVPLSAGTVAFGAATASASAKTTCATLSGNFTANPPVFNYGRCTGDTGGTGTSTGITSPATITWTATGKTTIFSEHDKALTGKKNKCASGDSEFEVTGKVSSKSTDKTIKGSVKGFTCVDASDNVSLQPGTVFTF